MMARVGAFLALAALASIFVLLPMSCSDNAPVVPPVQQDAGMCAHCGTQACCPSGSNWVCVDVSGDTGNCGACGNACLPGPAPDCANAACTCIGNGYQPCASSDTCCTTGCKNLQNDSNNCGNCGNKCPSGQQCVNGQCGCGTVGACTGTKICCGGQCVDKTTDNANCGFCNNACTNGATCQSGVCQGGGTCGGQNCPPGWTCCPDFCCRSCFGGNVCQDQTDGGV
jgi:hypothetical protein